MKEEERDIYQCHEEERRLTLNFFNIKYNIIFSSLVLNMEEQHLEPLLGDEGSDSDSLDGSDDDSSVEITSTIDEDENELVHLSTYLHLNSEDESNDEQSFEWPDPPTPLSSSSSHDIEELNNTQEVAVVSATSDTSAAIINTKEKSMKRKRRQWTIKEKLDVIALFDKNQSKRRTAKEKGCTTAQLRNWIENKEDLFKMCKKKKGDFFLFDLGVENFSLSSFRW